MFDSDTCHAVYLLAPHHSLVDFFVTLQNLAPDTPHREVLGWSYTQMILARTLPCFEMVEKNSVAAMTLFIEALPIWLLILEKIFR